MGGILALFGGIRGWVFGVLVRVIGALTIDVRKLKLNIAGRARGALVQRGVFG